MAFDPFAEDVVRHKGALEIGQDLSLLSIEEIDERTDLLKKEIERLKDAKSRKENSLKAASAFFNLGSA